MDEQFNVSRHFNLTEGENYAITNIDFYPIINEFNNGNLTYKNLTWESIDSNVTIQNAMVIPGNFDLYFIPPSKQWAGHAKVDFVKTTTNESFIDATGKNNHSIVFAVLPTEYDTRHFFDFETVFNLTILENSPCSDFETVSPFSAGSVIHSAMVRTNHTLT